MQNGRPWSARQIRSECQTPMFVTALEAALLAYSGEDHPRNLRRAVLWKDYAIHCTPGKSVTLFRLRDPDKPFKYSY